MEFLDRFLGRVPKQSAGSREADRREPDKTRGSEPEADRGTVDDGLADLMPNEAPEAYGEKVQEVVLSLSGLLVLDLRELPSRRQRVVGSFGWVTDAERSKYGGTSYLLVREPMNDFDRGAVAVYGKGRKVGYLTAAKAAALTPILDLLDFDAFRVGGASVVNNSIRLWIDVPALPALRALAKSHVKG